MIRTLNIGAAGLVLGLMLLAVVVPSSPSIAGPSAPRLHVFVPTDVRPRALQRVLSKQLPAVEVVVFGRYGDFERAQKQTPPDVVISLRPVLSSMSLEPQLQGLVANKASEPYVLLAFERGATQDLRQRVIGAVDLLGRAKTRAFIGRLLSISPAPKYKPVTKTDDLLPLLQFRSADVVLVPARLVPQFRARTKQPLEMRSLDGLEVDLPAAAALTVRGRDLLADIRAMPRTVNRIMGVEEWQAR